MGAKSMTPALQLRPQLLVIVDFAIENDGHVAIVGDYRLVS
jgi:hypothetical protein